MIKLRRSLALLLALLLALGGTSAWADGTLQLPQRLTEIEEEAFYGDSSLDYVIVPEGVHRIGERAFANSSVQTGYLPGSLGEIPDSAFANAPLQCVITPGGSEAGRWAEARGIHVAYNNELSVMPLDDNWWIYAQYGDTAELCVVCSGVDLEGSSVSWYRIETDNNGRDDWIGLDRHEFSLTTEPVKGHLRYVCRLTDRFGFQNDAWFEVMVDNGLELWAENGSDRVCVSYGESAALRVGFRANDTDDLRFQWYRVEQDENGLDLWTELAGETDTEFNTPAVTGQAQYVCRMTDRFGSMCDYWFRVSAAAQENAVSAAAAHDISGTAAWIPLTYSVTAELAAQGYRMGVLYTEIPGGLLPDENGRYENAYEWTWGGESGVYGPANAESFDGWLDELIPGHTYNYVACIVNEERDVVAVGDHPRHFTTTDGAEVYTLSLDERIAVAADYAKTPFRFVLPADGVYALNASVPMNEMSVRRTDDQTIARAEERESVSFYGTAGETVYLFVRDHVRDAEVWISAVGEVPDHPVVTSGIAGQITATQALIDIEYSVDAVTAEQGYGVGIAFSRNREDLMGLNEQGSFNCPMWDSWGEWSNSIAVNGHFGKLLDELIPDTTYYYLAYVTVNDRVVAYEDASTVEGIKSFHTGSGEEILPLRESVSETLWHAFPAEEKTAFRFTAGRDGIYGLTAALPCELSVYRADGSWLTGDGNVNQQIFALHEGETVYIFARNWQNSAELAIRRYTDFPKENSVEAVVADGGEAVGNTWVSLELTYDVIEETANEGYFVGVAFSQNPEDLELNGDHRFSCDMWDWEWRNIIANDVPVNYYIDQLIPDSEYFFRPYILVNEEVVCAGAVVNVRTTADAVETLTPGETKSFSGNQMLPLALSALYDGIYELCLDAPVDQVEMRRADGRHFGEYNGQETVQFYAGEGETVYFFLRNWDAVRHVSLRYIGGLPEQDEISFPAEEPEVGDTWASFRLVYTVSEDTYNAVCENDSYYRIGIVYSDGNISFDERGNYHSYYPDSENEPLLEDWSSIFQSIADHKEITLGLDRLMPNTSYSYAAYLEDSSGNVLAHTDVRSFSTLSDSMPTLSLGESVSVEKGNSTYRFVPETSGLYAVVSRGLESLEIRGGAGRWIAGDYSENWNDATYPYCQGFMAEAGAEYIIFAYNEFENVTLSVEPADALPALSEGRWSEEYDGRQVFRFTAPTDSWYRFEFISNDLGNISFANIETLEWNGYEDGSAAGRWLEAGQTVYPACWFDNDRARVRLRVRAFEPPQAFAISTLDVQNITDVSAVFSAQIAAPVLEEGQTYTYGIQLLRYDGAESFTGGTAWEETNADMSMVRWNATDPTESQTEYFSDRPLEPNTRYWYEAFVGVYDPQTDSDSFYYGGLKSFSTEALHPDRQVTEIFAGDDFYVPYRQDEDYQIFTFTVPEDPADVYTLFTRGSIWMIDPEGRCNWPQDKGDGRFISLLGTGCEGRTYQIYLREWDRNGEDLNFVGVYAEPIGIGAHDVYTDARLYSFTAPESTEYLIAAPVDHLVVAYSENENGFNHRSGWGWVTDPMATGESILFYCTGNGDETVPLTITNVTPYVDSEQSLRSAVEDAALVAQAHPNFPYAIHVDAPVELTEDLCLPITADLTLNAPLTVADGVTFTNQRSILVRDGAGLTVNGTLIQRSSDLRAATVHLQGGALTVNGSYSGDPNSLVLIDFGPGVDLDRQLAAVSGVPTSAVALAVDVADDATLARVRQLAPDYRHFEVFLADSFSPDTAVLRQLTECNITVHLPDGTVFTAS